MSLRDKCMLVQLSICKPQMQKKDRSATDETAATHNASTTSVAVIKKLYPKHLLAPITTIESAARRYVESMTEPRGKGLGVLPTVLFMEFQERIGQSRIQFQQAVTVFLNNYANVMAQAQVNTGTMFDPNEYPDVSSLKEQFTFEVLYPTLEAGNELTLRLEGESLEVYRKEVIEQQEQQAKARNKALFTRLGEAVGRIRTQCKNPEGKIYDSLTGNLGELLRILPALNLNEDPEFESMCREAAALVVAPESIRTVPEVREQLATKADEMLARMAAFL